MGAWDTLLLYQKPPLRVASWYLHLPFFFGIAQSVAVGHVLSWDVGHSWLGPAMVGLDEADCKREEAGYTSVGVGEKQLEWRGGRREKADRTKNYLFVSPCVFPVLFQVTLSTRYN